MHLYIKYNNIAISQILFNELDVLVFKSTSCKIRITLFHHTDYIQFSISQLIFIPPVKVKQCLRLAYSH